MVNDTIYKFYAIAKTLANSYEKFDDYLMLNNEKIMGYSVGLVGEIDELLEMGKTKEEIKNLILHNDYVAKDPELTEEEGEFLRNYSLKLLNIRYELYLEAKIAEEEEAREIKRLNKRRKY